MKTIRFGGPTFPERNQFVSSKSDPSVGLVKTWFYDLSLPDGEGGFRQTFAYFGDEFPIERVYNWQSYIDRGMASIVNGTGDSTGAVESDDSRETAAVEETETR